MSLHVRPGRLASSATTLAAALLAMALSMCLGFPRPWWVLMTVYVTTQPLAGALRPKMIYRLVGVFVGATVAVAATTLLSTSSLLLSLVLALWVGTCLGLAVLDRTPRTFAFMLAGYTAAIAAFPYVDQPGEIFTIAAARTEEMFLAIVCAITVHTVLLPWDPTVVLESRLPGFLRDVRAWVGDALEGGQRPQLEEERRRFAADISELSIIAVHLPPEAFRGAASRRALGAFQGCMSTLLSVASAVDDRLRALRERGEPGEPVAGLLRHVRLWLAEDRHADAAATRDLLDGCASVVQQLGPEPSWEVLLTASLGQRLADFVQTYADSHALMRHLLRPAQQPPPELQRWTARSPQRLRTDPGLAFLSGAAGAVAICLYCAFWILVSWPEGAATAAFAAIVSCSFASQDDPSPAILKYLGFTAAALPVSALYLFVILPRVDGVLMLCVVLAPVLLAMGFIQADQKRAPYALPMLACFIVAMGFLDRYTADFARFFNVALAQMGGVVVTLGPARLFRSVGADWTARRLLRAGWLEVAALAEQQEPPDEIGWSHGMIARLGAVAARIAYLRPWELLGTADVLNDLRVGRNVIRLRRARSRVEDPELRGRVDLLLGRLAELYRGRASQSAARPAPVALLEVLDQALSGAGKTPRREGAKETSLALVAIRRNLFSHARPYEAVAAS